MERKLVSIQIINDIQPIEGADRIERATVLGWSLVVRKGEFKAGDKCAYFEIDSLIPKTSWSEFLVDPNHPDKPIRLRTKKMKKVISQGLALPLSAVGIDGNVGDDITEKLGVTKWEPVIPAQLSGTVKGNFPSFCRKSDETRLQTIVPDIFEEMNGKEIYVTLKYDGTSASYFSRKSVEIADAYDTGVCSRNLLLKEPVEGETIPVYWEIERKYNILNQLKALNRNIQLICEIYGEGLQKNHLGIKGKDIAIFTAYDIDKQEYLGFYDLLIICTKLQIPMVKVVENFIFNKNIHTLEWWLEKANTAKYDNGSQAEGLVVRPIVESYSEVLKGRMSFKTISNNYLLKNEE
jgi:RNA ligase (TIGR02306 family)